MMHRCLLAAGLLAALTPAQSQGSEQEDEWIALAPYSEALSRAAFAACDVDADDRLSLLEVSRCVEGFADVRELEPFRFLDQNSDGFIQWPEFDRRFREIIESGRSFRIRPARDFVPPEAPKAPASPEDVAITMILEMFDADGDGALTMEELAEPLEQLGLPPAVLARAPELDVDGSGKFEADELAKLAPLLPMAAAAPAKNPLSGPAAASDEDASGSLDERELESALRRLHPSLARWTRQIMRDADKSGDRRLGAPELGVKPERPAPKRNEGR